MSSFRTLKISDPRFEAEHLRLITVKSPALGQRADISVFVPPAVADSKSIVPMVVLLHGVYGSHWSWTHLGGVHRTAMDLISQRRIRPMILVMPSDGLWGDGSGYLPHPTQNYERWITDDVIRATCEAIDPAEPEAPACIAGLSMGGFGALRLAAKYPDRFKGCAAHSSITRLEQLQQFVEEDLTSLKVEDTDKFAIAAMIANRDRLPPVRFDCGKDDPLLEHNRHLHEQLNANGIEHTYQEYQGGHDWNYWRTHIVETLLFFDRLI